jgi:hypothetical protein
MGERGLANVQIQPTQAALKETENEEKPMKWRHAWHNHCENSLSFTQKSKMGQVICNRQFCQLQCPDNTRYVDGKPRVSCTRFYDTSDFTEEYRWSDEIGSCRVCKKPKKIHDPRKDLEYSCHVELIDGKQIEKCDVTCRPGFIFHDRDVDSYTIQCDIETEKWSGVKHMTDKLQCRKSIF